MDWVTREVFSLFLWLIDWNSFGWNETVDKRLLSLAQSRLGYQCKTMVFVEHERLDSRTLRIVALRSRWVSIYLCYREPGSTTGGPYAAKYELYMPRSMLPEDVYRYTPERLVVLKSKVWYTGCPACKVEKTESLLEGQVYSKVEISLGSHWELHLSGRESYASRWTDKELYKEWSHTELVVRHIYIKREDVSVFEDNASTLLHHWFLAVLSPVFLERLTQQTAPSEHFS